MSFAKLHFVLWLLFWLNDDSGCTLEARRQKFDAGDRQRHIDSWVSSTSAGGEHCELPRWISGRSLDHKCIRPN